MTGNYFCFAQSIFPSSRAAGAGGGGIWGGLDDLVINPISIDAGLVVDFLKQKSVTIIYVKNNLIMLNMNGTLNVIQNYFLRSKKYDEDNAGD